VISTSAPKLFEARPRAPAKIAAVAPEEQQAIANFCLIINHLINDDFAQNVLQDSPLTSLVQKFSSKYRGDLKGTTSSTPVYSPTSPSISSSLVSVAHFYSLRCSVYDMDKLSKYVCMEEMFQIYIKIFSSC